MNNFFIGFLLCCLPSFHLFANKWQDLTLEEKIGQLLIVHFRGESANDISDFFLKNTHVGGFIFYNWSNGLGSRDQVRNLTLSLTEQNKKYSSTPLFFSLDQEGGKVQRLTHEFSSFPSNATLSNLNIPSITYLSGKIQAKELKEVGIHINFSPVVDILCYPNHTTVGDRSYGNSVNKVIAMASNYLKAYSEENVLAVIKHFPGLGGSHIDCHYGTPTCLKSFSQISSLELMPFFYLSSQSDAIMTSHIFLPAIDPIHVASTSKSFIHDLLCQQWKFKGLIISDSLCMEGVILHEGSLHLAARHAILAGTDLLCLGGRILNGDTGKELSHQDILDLQKKLVLDVQEGIIPLEILNNAVEKILKFKAKYCISNELYTLKAVDRESHALFSRELSIYSTLIHLDNKRIEKISKKVWQNETGSSMDNIIYWNPNEDFISLGIGHFTWHPADIDSPFEENFPSYLEFVQSQGKEIPDWIRKADHCPWKNRMEYMQNQTSKEVIELKKWLIQTMDLQGAFLIQKIPNMLYQIIEQTSTYSQKLKFLDIIEKLIDTPNGSYALIDYINFKGSGLSLTERYKGQGWGLLQVLEKLSQEESANIVEDFVLTAENLLRTRVHNSPDPDKEGKWIKGWLRRIHSYNEFK